MYDKDLLLDIYRKLYTIRIFETSCLELYRQGFIYGYFHPYLGEEAIAVGACSALTLNDYIVSTHRGHGHCIAWGADIRLMAAELMGKETGYCRGLGGSMHIADITAGNLGANGIVGGGIPIGVGAALASSLKGDQSVCVIFFSDGATHNGVFSESMNLAAIWNLPVIFMLENNQYSVSTPVEMCSRDTDLFKRATGYSVESYAIDGNNVFEVYDSTMDATAKCRAGKGPVMIEAKTFRHGGHHVNDSGTYLPEDKLEYYKSKDPVSTAKGFLLTDGNISEDKISEIESAVEKEMEQAIEFAKSSKELSVDDFFKMAEV